MNNPTITDLRNAINKAEEVKVNNEGARQRDVEAAIGFYNRAFGAAGETRSTLIAFGILRAQKAARA